MNKDLFGYEFYDGEPPSQKHSRTSRAAASSIAPRIGALHRLLYAWLREHPDGATDEEMQDDIGMAANTQRPRRRELQLAGYIEDSGRTRLTRAARSAVVWRLSGMPFPAGAGR